jgi:predicted transcriptional regulator
LFLLHTCDVKPKKQKVQLRRSEALIAFGNHLREIRESKKLSQEELAYQAGLSQSQIYRIEKGLINTTVSTVVQISEALEVNCKDLFDFKIKD